MSGLRFTLEICMDHGASSALRNFVLKGGGVIQGIKPAQVSIVSSAGMAIQAQNLILADGGVVYHQDGLYNRTSDARVRVFEGEDGLDERKHDEGLDEGRPLFTTESLEPAEVRELWGGDDEVVEEKVRMAVRAGRGAEERSDDGSIKTHPNPKFVAAEGLVRLEGDREAQAGGLPRRARGAPVSDRYVISVSDSLPWSDGRRQRKKEGGWCFRLHKNNLDCLFLPPLSCSPPSSFPLAYPPLQPSSTPSQISVRPNPESDRSRQTPKAEDKDGRVAPVQSRAHLVPHLLRIPAARARALRAAESAAL